MECFLLGTGGMMPIPSRLLTSLAVKLNGRIYLFDAGECAQLGWKKVGLGIRGFRSIAVSHLHADHCLGIPGLMMLRAQMESPESLTIIGPPGITDFILQIQKMLAFHINYPISFKEWTEECDTLAYEDEQIKIFWHPLQHTRFCLGYRLEERERPGKFNTGKALQLNIPKGPLWGRLQQGESVSLKDGRQIEPSQVLGPSRKGRSVAYVVDTSTCKNIYRLCNNVDIAFLEGMFLPEDAHQATDKHHLTVSEAARLAKRSNVGKAILVHISPRYNEDDIGRLRSAAKEIFAEVDIGGDFANYAIPHKK